MISIRINHSKIFIALFVVVAITLIGYLTTQNYKSKVIVNGKAFIVDVSDTAYTKTKGLSGRDPLKTNEGMIFLFEKPEKEGFWMKDMKFSIDIIWIDENMSVIHIEKSLSPDTYPKVYYPESPAKYVLEVSSGQADALGLKLGDKIEFYR
jgi:uncharacterized membrane protein (UPF0127 family)